MSAFDSGSPRSEISMIPVLGPAIQSFQSKGITRDGAEALVNGNLPSDPVDKLQVGNAVQGAASRNQGVLGIPAHGGKTLVDWRAKNFGQGGSAAGFVARSGERTAAPGIGDVAQAGLAAMQLNPRRMAGGTSSVSRGTQTFASQVSNAAPGVVALGPRGPYSIGGATGQHKVPSVGVAGAILGKIF